MSEQPKGPGQPSPRNRVVDAAVLYLYREGKTDSQVAGILGICEKTINNWKKDPEFLQSIREAKLCPDDLVEHSLFQLTQGFHVTEQQVVRTKDGADVLPVTKFIAPNVQACRFWLSNRRPDQWRERKEGGGAEEKVPLQIIFSQKEPPKDQV